MKYSFLLLVLMILSFSTWADCPDVDGDGHPELCIEEGKLIESEDNCPSVSNPDQLEPSRWTLSDSGTYELIKEKGGDGLACNYDINGDGIYTVLDLHFLYTWVVRTPPLELEEATIGDFDNDKRYTVLDFCAQQDFLISINVYPTFINFCPLLIQNYYDNL